jgi:gas vesicle protein
MEDRESGGISFLSFMMGAGIGALVGAAVALLLAPQSGRESREDVKESLSSVVDRAEGLLSRIKTAGSEFVEEKKTLIGKAAQAYRVGVEEKKKELEETSKPEA